MGKVPLDYCEPSRDVDERGSTSNGVNQPIQLPAQEFEAEKSFLALGLEELPQAGLLSASGPLFALLLVCALVYEKQGILSWRFPVVPFGLQTLVGLVVGCPFNPLRSSSL